MYGAFASTGGRLTPTLGPGAMQIELHDITPLYLEYAIRQREQAYFATYPELFRHYYQYWVAPGDLVRMTENTVQEKATLIKSKLPVLERAFTCKGFSGKIRVVLFVGANTTNGHAFWDETHQSFVVWLPVETYDSPLQVDVFVAHEIIHALHYTRCPEFYFQDERAKHLVGRQVITEGIATRGTQKILACDDVMALWADYVSLSFARQWHERCGTRLSEMAQRILNEWDDSQETNEWFSLWDENDVTRYRGGYYVGLRAIEKISQERVMNLQSLLALEKQELEALILRALREMAEGRA
ncbi:MAG: hypothetical protein D6694_13485 [Gammaproteobacteria bacterium]|nr:MAG: hypothetical protein D6694_13485 [Gammaproteobacteria bacterium]